MGKQRIYFIFLFFICGLMPSVAIADIDYDISIPDEPDRRIRPGESMTIVVDVWNTEDDSPVPGRTVTFSVSPDDGSVSLSTTSETTDSNGQARTTVTFGNDSSGKEYVFRVTVDNVDKRLAFSRWVATVSDGAVFNFYKVTTRRYHPGESVEFLVSLRKGGKGVSGRTVTFSLSPDDGTASLSTTSGTTDGNGDVRTSVVLGSDASGSYSITATLDDGTSKTHSTGTIYNPNLPSGFSLDMYVPRGAIPMNPGESRTFIAIVRKDGNDVSGETVKFSVSPDDGTVSLSPTSATTGSDGRASTSLTTGSGSSGTYKVTATLDNGQSIYGTSTVTGEPVGEIVGAIGEPANNPPVFTDGTSTTRTIAENAASGQNIGSPVSATDEDSDTLTYTLGGTDAAAFGIVSSTGQLQTNAALDYENKASYTVTVGVSDGRGGSDSITVTINVTDVDETSSPRNPQDPPPENPLPQDPPSQDPPPQDPPSQDPPPEEPQQQQGDASAQQLEDPQQQQGDASTQQEDASTQEYVVLKGEPGQLVLSEFMFESTGGLHSRPQWIELYNTTDTDINLRGWQLVWYRREPKLLDVTTTFQTDFIIPAKSARLIVSRGARKSEQSGLNDVYTLFSHHSDELDQSDGVNRNRLISRGGFFLKLRDGKGTLIDQIGTLTDKRGDVTWELPECLIEGQRSSLIRRFDDETPRAGIERQGWIRAYDTKAQSTHFWYGRNTDIGSPAYRSDDSPLPVTLSHFRTEQTDTGVLLKWTTESEVDNAGFYIYRGETKNGEFKAVNPTMIAGAGTTSERTEYKWTDTTAKPNVVYYYRIADVSHAGVQKQLATVRLRGFVSAKDKLVIRWADMRK